MTILGVVPSTEALHVCTITFEDGTAAIKSMKKVPLPKSSDETAKLDSLLKLINTLILETGAARVAILQAGRTKFGGPSTLRTKVECCVQLAAAARSIPVDLVAPQSLRAFEKKHDPLTLTDGEKFSPVGCADAALVAWYSDDHHAKA
jgi:hypothetical protein